VSHIGSFPHLEEEMVTWEPNTKMDSPNRMDALVWALTELMLDGPGEAQYAPSPFEDYRGD
jgi:phage terminase large subunit-like protein